MKQQTQPPWTGWQLNEQERQDLAAVLVLLEPLTRTRGLRAREILALAESNAELKAALVKWGFRRSFLPEIDELACRLRQGRDQPVAGLKLCRKLDRNGVAVWWIETACEVSPASPAPSAASLKEKPVTHEDHNWTGWLWDPCLAAWTPLCKGPTLSDCQRRLALLAGQSPPGWAIVTGGAPPRFAPATPDRKREEVAAFPES